MTKAQSPVTRPYLARRRRHIARQVRLNLPWSLPVRNVEVEMVASLMDQLLDASEGSETAA